MPSRLNYNHLFYFWLAARHRNLTRAARELDLAQPTVSAQIRSLERALDVALLTRRGRHIDLTEAGQIVFRHADEMFRISSDIPDALAGRNAGAATVLRVGIADFVPKPVVRRILEPVLRRSTSITIECSEWRLDELFAELALFRLDLVLSDRPHPGGSGAQALSHLVLETAVEILARPALARQLRRGFPRSLHGAPLFLPARNAAIRGPIDRWLEANGVRPAVLGEFEDRELLKSFGQTGMGAFPAAAIIEDEVRRQFGVERVGWVRGVRETYFAITVQRRFRHPCLHAIFAAPTERLRTGAARPL